MLGKLLHKLLTDEKPNPAPTPTPKFGLSGRTVPVILEDGVIEEEPIEAVMDNEHCIAVNHEYYHLRLNCPCLNWEMTNNNEYGERKQFTMKEAKELRMNTCPDCFEYMEKRSKSVSEENE